MFSSESQLRSRLQQLLISENISGREFARRAQLHHQQAHDYLTGVKTPSLALIDRICAAFPPLTPWDLIKPDEPESEPENLTLADLAKRLDRIEKLLRER